VPETTSTKLPDKWKGKGREREWGKKGRDLEGKGRRREGRRRGKGMGKKEKRGEGRREREEEEKRVERKGNEREGEGGTPQTFTWIDAYSCGSFTKFTT